MLVVCRKCKKSRQSYVRRLCKQCYQALKKQESRGSPNFDAEMLYPQECCVPFCRDYVEPAPGLAMCGEHHATFYHTSGYFESFGCKCPQSGCAT